MDKKERLIKAYNYLRGEGIVNTQQDVADILKASRTNVSSALKGDERVLTDKFLLRFAKAFDDIISGTWLLTGEGDMLLKHQEPRVIDQGSLTNAALAAYNTAIEQANARVAMLQQQLADERDAHALELQRINAAHRQEIADKQEIIRLLRQQASSNIINYPTGATDGQLKKKHIPTL